MLDLEATSGGLRIVLELARGVGLMTAVLALYSFVRRSNTWLPTSVGLGLLFGTGGILAMVDPLDLSEGVFVDMRNSMVALAAPFGGPAAVVVSGVMIGGTRLLIGGIGAVPSALATVAIACIAIAVTRVWRISADKITLLPLFTFSACAALSPLSTLLLPEQGFELFLAFGPAVAACLFLGTIFFGVLLGHEERRFALERMLEEAALTDPLTKLPNRRAFDAALGREVARRDRTGTVFSLLVIDIDHFKTVNDTFGHDAGDAVLVAVGQSLAKAARTADVIARFGGEEFVALLPMTDAQAAEKAGNRLRKAIEDLRITINEFQIGVTASVGAVSAARGVDPALMFAAADAAVYRAKRGGRNRVELADSPVPPATVQVAAS